MRTRISYLIVMGIFLMAWATAQTPSTTVVLKISGEVERPLNLMADLSKLSRRTVRAKTTTEKTEFSGVRLSDVLQLAGVKFGEEMRGKNLSLYLLAEAADNYRAVYALPELDAAFTDKMILLADQRDGKPLSEKEGPLRIVVPDEKRQGRWVRQVVSLVIKRAS